MAPPFPPFPPSTMRVWQYSSTRGGLSKNLKLKSTQLPKHNPNEDLNLVQVIATALNPIDYKPAESPILGRLMVPKPATPGIDFAGCIVTPARNSPFKRGQLVFGAAGTTPFAGGSLAEFTLAKTGNIAALPDGVSPIDAATVCVAGLTAYYTIVPRVKKGDKIFINGGSGGVGVFGIQIAKIVGCHVTTTCSTKNVEFCKSLGADVVIDYTKESVIKALNANSQKFDHVVDNIGADRTLYWRCHEYTRPGTVYVMVGADLSLSSIMESLQVKLWPLPLGGGQRNRENFFLQPRTAGLEQIGTWMKEGKVRAAIDEKVLFEEAPKAFKKLKTGRARGKIVVEVASKTCEQAWLE